MNKQGELKNKAVKGIKWSFLQQISEQTINFIITIVLARLLLPSEFGLIGMIAIFIAISKSLVDGGFISSLIRTKKLDNLDYSTVFFVNLISSFVLYCLLFFLAPYIANFYNEPILIKLIRVMALLLPVNALSIIQSARLTISLDFRRKFIILLPSMILSALISVGMAYQGYGVWSLVIKDLCFSVFATSQLWWYSKWTPSFVFDKEKFKYHFSYGYKISFTQIINTSFQNLYKVIIGKFFSATQLGYFSYARSLEQLPSGFFYNAFNRVFYPLLAQVNDDNTQLKRFYSQLMGLVVFIVTPIMIYMGVVATPLFRWLLTEKWLPAVPYFQLLIISAVFYPIHQYNLNICKLKGRSDLVLKLSILQNFFLLVGAFTAIWFGIYGLLVSLIIVNITVTLINASISGKLISYNLKEQSSDLIPIFLLNILAGSFFYILQTQWLIKLQDFWNLIISGISFFIFYTFVAYVTRMETLKDLFLYIKK